MKYVLDYNYFLLESKDFFQEGIKQNQVSLTKEHIIETLLPLLRLKEEDVSFIGSAGKLLNPDDISHNIDFIIDKDKFISSNNIKDNAQKTLLTYFDRLGYKSKVKDEDTITVEWPIEGNEDSNFIELIIELSDNFEWVSFARYSPTLHTGESKYQGKYRTALLSSIVESLDKKVISYSDKNDTVESYTKLLFSPSKGIFRIYKKFNIQVNTASRIAVETKDSRKLVTNKPEEFVGMIFDGVGVNDINTFESLRKLIYDSECFKFINKLPQIKKRFHKKCLELNLDEVKL